jgi:hypothetical protein
MRRSAPRRTNRSKAFRTAAGPPYCKKSRAEKTDALRLLLTDLRIEDSVESDVLSLAIGHKNSIVFVTNRAQKNEHPLTLQVPLLVHVKLAVSLVQIQPLHPI